MKPVRLAVIGALGRLGRSIVDAASKDPSFAITAAVVHNEATAEDLVGVPIFTSLDRVTSGCDIVVDVSRAESVERNVEWAAKKKLPYILAVTGISKRAEQKVESASETIAIVVAPNLSVGVAVLNEAAALIARSFESEVDIVETHHKAKKDAPSGTALSLANTIGQNKKSGEVTLHSIRGGDVVGEHRVTFLSNGERIELLHSATSREIFARGALVAARFLIGKKPGIYTMREVLNLKESKS